MRSYEVDVYDAHELEQWIGQLSSGRTDQVIIRDSDAVVAVLRKPDPDTPAGWILAGHFYDDKELPPPFDSVGCDSNNVGACVWIHLISGAMVAAIPTGRWNDQAGFAFYYAGPNGTSAIPLSGWTGDQRQWDGTDPNAFDRHRDQAIAYFNSRV
ncbi:MULTISPECIES: hypothetical protein [Mycobacterium avium complex (MAC)]|uniref:hypothetical protein n=1 Tax=Mycobacterium avium TaxID=1764 RepID=UPI000B2AD774|nr:hypothetical protein [Mycobacterium avium]MDO2354297.1 hypothetical protein [Mycobacterium avium subsp. hominissuis]